MYYKITVEFPNPCKGYSVEYSLEELREMARRAWSNLEGCLDDPWSQVLGIQPPEFVGYDDDATDQLTGAYNAWSSYLLDNLTPEQVGMIWAHDGGRYTVEEVKA